MSKFLKISYQVLSAEFMINRFIITSNRILCH